MCSIFGSTDPDEFMELADLNQSRGLHRYSITRMFKGQSKIGLPRLSGEGSLPRELNMDRGDYYIGHVQTKTGIDSGIHPAFNGQYSLYHNGIMLPGFVPEHVQWDTQWLLNFITKDPTSQYIWFVDRLRQIHGSFACVLMCPPDDTPTNGLILVFRNDNAPLYHSGATISSVPFSNSVEVPANHVHVLNIHFNELQPCKHGEFTNADTMYRIT